MDEPNLVRPYTDNELPILENEWIEIALPIDAKSRTDRVDPIRATP
jgi:hypothetical protein